MLPSGSYTALVTPMDTDNNIQWSALRKLLDWHLSSGTRGLVILGTTGESATISYEEKIRYVEEVVAHIANKIPVIVGAGANCTKTTCKLVQEFSLFGVDACMLVTPYYNLPNQKGLLEHFKYINDSVDVPLVLYNVPARTGVSLSCEVVARLSGLDNIVGIKDATGDVNYLKELKSLIASNFLFFSGDDATILDFIEAGGNGAISVVANVVPAHVHNLCEAALVNDVVSAQQIFDEIKPLIDVCKLDVNPIPIKYILNLLGKIGKGIRLPLVSLDYEKQQLVKDVVGRMGLLTMSQVMQMNS